ncbi:hypothetical protein [Streptomyces tauricus]|uniref:hypothetical protein n=1 Tax=Streptomyces tauricus TaxID=68274 RepID=UPI0034428A9E
MPTLTKDAVTLYDIDTRTVWHRMSVRDGERDVRISRDLGDIVQEYATTDRDGRPLRIVLQISTAWEYGEPDPGGVYEFPR